MKLSQWICQLVLGLALCQPGIVLAQQARNGGPAAAAKPSNTHPAITENGSVMLRSDAACSFQVDGEEAAQLTPWSLKKISLSPGEHYLLATSSDGQDHWEQVIQLQANASKVILIDLVSVRANREKQQLEQAEQQRRNAEAAELKQRDAASQREHNQKEAAQQAEKQAKEEASRKLQARLNELRNQAATLGATCQQETDAANYAQQQALMAQQSSSGTGWAASLSSIAATAQRTAAQQHLQKAQTCNAQLSVLRQQINQLGSGQF